MNRAIVALKEDVRSTLVCEQILTTFSGPAEPFLERWTYDEHFNHGNDTDCERQAVRMPPAGIRGMKDCIVHVAAWRSCLKRYNDDKNTRNMEDQNESFSDGQPSCEIDVEESAECDNGDGEEGLMPRMDLILG